MTLLLSQLRQSPFLQKYESQIPPFDQMPGGQNQLILETLVDMLRKKMQKVSERLTRKFIRQLEAIPLDILLDFDSLGERFDQGERNLPPMHPRMMCLNDYTRDLQRKINPLITVANKILERLPGDREIEEYDFIEI